MPTDDAASRARETKLLRQAIKYQKEGAQLTEEHTKLLKEHGIYIEKNAKYYKDQLANAERYVEALNKRLTLEKDLGEVIAQNNKMQRAEIEIYNTKIKEANQTINEFEQAKLMQETQRADLAEKLNQIREKEKDLDAKIGAAWAEGNKERQKKLNEELDTLKASRTETQGQQKANIKLGRQLVKNKKAAEDSLPSLHERRDIEQDIGDSNESLQASTKSFLKTFTGVTDQSNSFLGSIIKSKQATGGFGKAFGQIGKTMKATFSPKNIGLSVLMKVFESTIAFMKEFDTAAANFRKSTGLVGDGFHEQEQAVVNVQRANLAYGVTLTEAFAAQNALVSGMASFTSMSRKQSQQILQVTALMGEFGISAETTADIFNTFSKGLGYDAEQLEELGTQLMGISESLKMPPKIIAEDFQQAAGELMKYGDDMLEVFEGLEEQSKQTGIGMQELLGIAKQFDTFEDAGNAVGRLNAILGGPYLNAIEMVYATEEERIKAMRESIKMSGQQFKNMNRFEKQAIMSAAGINDMSTAMKLFGGTTTEFADHNMKMEEMKDRAQKAQAVQEKLTQVVQTLAIAFAPLVDALAVLADILLFVLNPIGKLAEYMGADSDMIAGIGLMTASVYGLTAGMVALGVSTKSAFAFAMGLVAGYKTVMAIFEGLGVILGVVIGLLIAGAAAWAAFHAAETLGFGVPLLLAAGVAVGALAATLMGTISGIASGNWLPSFEVGTGGPRAEQDALTHAGESKEDRFGNVTPITQTGVDHLEDGTTVHSAGATESRRLGAAGKSGPGGITQQQGQQIIALLTALGTDPGTAAAGGGDTVINLVMDPAGTKVIAKGLIKQGDVRKDTTEKLKTNSGLSITKAGR